MFYFYAFPQHNFTPLFFTHSLAGCHSAIVRVTRKAHTRLCPDYRSITVHSHQMVNHSVTTTPNITEVNVDIGKQDVFYFLLLYCIA